MSDQEDWERLKSLFYASLDRDGREREAFLNEACSDAPDLRLRLSRMLAAHENEPSFLEEPAFIALEAERPPADTAPPRTVAEPPGAPTSTKSRRSRQAFATYVLLPLAAAFGLLSNALGQVPIIADLERKTVDLRFRTAPARFPDTRILLLVADDDAFTGEPPTHVEEADRFGELLSAVFAAGAAAVAVDLLLPESWSQSPRFSQMVVRHADRLTLAALSTPSGVVGTKCIPGWTAIALGSERASNLFGLINFETDADGVTRSGRVSYPDHAGRERLAWGPRAALTLTDRVSAARSSGRTERQLESYWIDYRIDWSRFERVSWKDVLRISDERPETFRERLVLVGSSRGAAWRELRLPGGGDVPGLVVQALATETALRDFPIRKPSVLAAMAISGVVSVLTALLVLYVDSRSRVILLIAAMGCAMCVFSWLLLARFGFLTPAVPPIVILVVTSVAVLTFRGHAGRVVKG